MDHFNTMQSFCSFHSTKLEVYSYGKKLWQKVSEQLRFQVISRNIYQNIPLYSEAKDNVVSHPSSYTEANLIDILILL